MCFEFIRAKGRREGDKVESEAKKTICRAQSNCYRPIEGDKVMTDSSRQPPRGGW